MRRFDPGLPLSRPPAHRASHSPSGEPPSQTAETLLEPEETLSSEKPLFFNIDRRLPNVWPHAFPTGIQRPGPHKRAVRPSRSKTPGPQGAAFHPAALAIETDLTHNKAEPKAPPTERFPETRRKDKPVQSLTGLTTEELQTLVLDAGHPAYRGKQIAQWIYSRGASDYAHLTDVPRALRDTLAQTHTVAAMTTAHRDIAPDGTIKSLLRMNDGKTVESVYLPYPDRVSVCLSSQVGCAAGCTFCATAQGGLMRHLTAGEIVGQFLTLQRESERRISHAVYMGMGEPLWNYDATVKSLRLLGNEVGVSLRNLTVSTVGVVSGIRALAQEDLPVTLALSLHAPNDDLRAKLIPTARKWKLDEILEACREYAETTKRNLTFEYLMIGGINDSPEQARELGSLLKARRLPGNVNLIPFNYVNTPQGYRRPEKEAVTRFKAELERLGRPATLRITRGHAISAACGQLKQTLTPNRGGEIHEILPLVR